jgi:proton-dependent oligopeptide transporter, POT family
MSQDTPVGQPRGLSPLFFTEMWERFSFYGMRAIFSLFMVEPLMSGGLGYNASQAGAILSIYMSMVYMMSLPGGWIADKYLGQRRSVFIGAIIIMIGHILLAVPSTLIFFFGLGALVIGTGFLKPNVSTMVGQLYAKSDPRRDGGFSIFYMGINVGAFVSPIICGYLAQDPSFKTILKNHGIDPNSSWHFGFAAAAVGMFLGLIIFHFGTRSLVGVGAPPVIRDAHERATNRKTLLGIIGALLAAPLLLCAIHYGGIWSLSQERIANLLGLVLLVIFMGTFIVLFLQAKGKERMGVVAMFTLAVGSVAFFALFEQAAGTMNAFADDHTRNVAFGSSFPSSWYQSVNSIFIILLSPLFAWFFTKVAAAKLPFNDIMKFGVALVFIVLAFVLMLPAIETPGLASPMYLVLFYFLSTVAELFLSPVGLSSMSKLAPASAGGLVMGVWFMSTANGEYLAGMLYGITAKVKLDTLFIWLSVIVLAVAAIMFAVGWYFTKVVPLESLMRDPEEGSDASTDDLPNAKLVTKGKAGALDAKSTVSGDAIAAFATAAAIWPVVLNDAKLGGLVVAILGPSALVLAWRGWNEIQKGKVGGRGYVTATLPLALGAGLYTIVKIFF